MRTLVGIWNQFWFKESTGRSEAYFRVGYSFTLLCDLFGMHSKVRLLFSNQGVHHATPLDGFYPPFAVEALYGAWIVIVCLLFLGIRTRLMSVLNFCLTTYFFSLRGYGASHVADWAHQTFGFCLMWQTSGRFFSLEKLWKNEAGQKPISIWPVRLTQISIACVYFTSGISKVSDPGWRAGTAFLDTIRSADLSSFNLGWLPEHPVFHILNYGVIAWEIFIPVFWLFPLTRPWAVLSSFFFHGGIWLLLRVGWFTETMFAALFIFWDDCFPPKERKTVPPGTDAPLFLFPSWDRCRKFAIQAFLCFHLFAVISAQTAYAGRTFDPKSDWWRFFKRYPLPVRVYVNHLSRLIYYNLWPSPIFFGPLKLVTYRGVHVGGAPAGIPPFDEKGMFTGGITYWKEARWGLLLKRMGNYGLTEKQWTAFVRHLVLLYREKYGVPHPSEIELYRVDVYPKRAAEGNVPKINVQPLAVVKVRQAAGDVAFDSVVTPLGQSMIMPPGESWYREGDAGDWLDKLTARYGIGF